MKYEKEPEEIRTNDSPSFEGEVVIEAAVTTSTTEEYDSDLTAFFADEDYPPSPGHVEAMLEKNHSFFERYRLFENHRGGFVIVCLGGRIYGALRKEGEIWFTLDSIWWAFKLLLSDEEIKELSCCHGEMTRRWVPLGEVIQVFSNYDPSLGRELANRDFAKRFAS